MASSVRIDGSAQAVVPPGTTPASANEGTVFAGRWMVRYDWVADRALANTLRRLPFPAPFDRDLEGALFGRGGYTAFLYLFQGGNYLRLDRATLAPTGAPTATAAAWGLPTTWTRLDAVCPGGGVKIDFAYFLRGSDYSRFDWVADHASPNYPKALGPNWHTTAPLTGDVDGIIGGLGPTYGTKAYVVKTVSTTVNDDGQAVPAGTGRVVSAPIYQSYDFDAEQTAAPVTDPATVVANWVGLFPLLDAGAAIDVALGWCTAALAALAVSPLAPATVTAFGHHFMTTAPNATTIATVANRFNQIKQRLEALPDRFTWTAGIGFAAQTVQGVLTEIGDQFSTIHGPNGRAAVLIHEAVHFTFGTTVDVPEWSGETVNGVAFGQAVIDGVTQPVYSTISTADALVNPSSYAAFAQEIAFAGTPLPDTRFGIARRHE